MSDSGKAVFLSYASQDAEAAKRICDALRAAGVEVWFDQSELVGGDAWDQQIRRQIGSCALLIPVISANTQARREGYFRLEWRLAVERMRQMDDDLPFLLPVVIDETKDAEAFVPERFREVQWTRLKGGETPPAFVARVKKLLGGEVGPVSDRPPGSKATETGHRPVLPQKRPRWLAPVIAGVAVAAVAWVFTRPWEKSAATPAQPASAPAANPLVARAWAIIRSEVVTKEGLDAAQEFCRQAIARDSTDAEAWAVAAQADALVIYYAFDTSEERRQQAQQKAARALVLAPDSFKVRHAQAKVFGYATGSQPMREEAAKRYRTLIAEQPADRGLKIELGTILRDLGQVDEAAALFEQVDDLNSAGWNYVAAGRNADAQRVADRWLQRGRNPGALLMQFTLKAYCAQDLAAAHEFAGQFTTTELLDDGAAMCAIYDGLFRRDAEAMIKVLTAFPREYLALAKSQRGPKRYFLGLAHEIAGNLESARGEWRLAVEQMRERQKAAPNDVDALGWEALLQARLGERAEAERLLALFRTKEQTDELRRVMVSTATWAALGLGGKVHDELETFRRQSPQRFLWVHAMLRFSPEYDALRGEPWFGKFLRDTLPPGAKPFDDPKPLSEARQLSEKAWQLAIDSNRDSQPMLNAIEMAERAIQRDKLDGEVWAVAALVDIQGYLKGVDRTEARKVQIRTKVARAKSLAPRSVLGRLAEARMLFHVDPSPENLAEAERILRDLETESLGERDAANVAGSLALILQQQGHYVEAGQIFERAAGTNYPGWLNSASWAYLAAGKFPEAQAAAEKQMAVERETGLLQLAMVHLIRGDLVAARAAMDRMSPASRRDEVPLSLHAWLGILSREPEGTLADLQQLPGDTARSPLFRYPKRYLVGLAHQLAGRPEVARLEWQAALRGVDQKLAEDATVADLQQARFYLLAALDRGTEATQTLQLMRQLKLVPVGAEGSRYFAVLHDHEETLRQAERALRPNSFYPEITRSFMRHDPAYDFMRDDPRWQKLLRENLPEGAKPFDDPKPEVKP